MATTSDVAGRLGVTPSTVRNYTRAFADYLSPGARPDQGQRTFTDRDIRVLQAAKSFLDQGQTYAQVGDNLAASDLEDLPPVSEPEPSTSTALVPLATIQALTQRHDQELARVLEERDELLQEVRELHHRIGELEAQARPWWRRLLGR